MASAIEQEVEPGQSLVARKPTMLRPIAEPAQMIEAQNEMRALVRGALKQGAEPGTGDYGIMPGTEKKALWKPGAEKIALGMGCMFGAPRVVEKEIDHDRVNNWVKRKKEWSGPQDDRRFKWVDESGASYGLYRYVISVAVINRATGEVVGEGIGAASTMEAKYIDRPRDCENTVLKMAQKRAMVHATLIAFGLSGEFASGEDEEAIEGETQEGAAPPAKKAAPATNGAAPAKCKKCSGATFYDNRADKASGKVKSSYPDFKCKNKECGAGVWLSSKDVQDEDPGPDGLGI